MTRRNFLHRVNRGLVLAGALLAGLIVFLVIGAVQFRSEIPAIEQMIHDYAAAAEGLMVLPEEYQRPDTAPPQAVIEAKIEESEPILRRYLSDRAVTQWGMSAFQSVSSAQSGALMDNRDNRSYITDSTFRVVRVSRVRRISNNLAMADIEVRVEVDTIGDPGYILFLHREWGRFHWDNLPDMPQIDPLPPEQGSSDTDEPEESAPEEEAPEVQTARRTEQVTFPGVFLRKVDGSWKISEISSGGHF